jgi:ribulose-5-phosphate 4-epimerase/fuculose-1-phosphate aldolase
MSQNRRRVPSNSPADQQRVKLAAAHRMAVLDGLNEGTWNHFSAVVPDRPNHILATPGNRHWRRVTASSLVEVGPNGQPLDQRQQFDSSAYYIHYPIHAARPDAVCVLHAHPPYVTALSMVTDGEVLFADQNAAIFFDRIAYYDEYDGFILDQDRGHRLVDALGDKRVLFLRNHGVLVVGPTIAEAYSDLYSLERACMFQAHAKELGGPVKRIPAEICRTTALAADKIGYKLTHFDAMCGLLDFEQPDYRD